MARLSLTIIMAHRSLLTQIITARLRIETIIMVRRSLVQLLAEHEDSQDMKMAPIGTRRRLSKEIKASNNT